MPLNHVGTKTLHTKRLVLRPFTPNDAQAMFNNWASDPEVTKFMLWQTHASPADTAEYLENIVVPSYANKCTYHWCITLDGEPIGAIGSIIISERSMSSDLAYCLGRKWWKQGIVSEAAQAVIDFCFGTVGFNRIEAHHAVDNPGSGGVMKKCGMQYEGHIRQKYLSTRGQLEDCDLYAILKEDWKADRHLPCHIGTKTLHTERLTLRPYTIDDAQAMFDNWTSDPDVARYVTWDTHTSVADSEKFLAYSIEQYSDPSNYHWCIESDGKAVGDITLRCHGESDAEIGYCLSKSCWGKGIMTEAAVEVIHYGFEEVGFKRILGRHLVKNPASGAVMKKCGMRFDGTTPDTENVFNKGQNLEMAHYSIENTK